MSEGKKFNYTSISDEDKNLQTSQGGKFGLNVNCHFSLIDFTDKAGKDETDGNAVDINILVGDKEFKRRVYDPEGAPLYGKDNTQLNPGDEGYEALLEAQLTQASAMVLHAIKATGVTEDTVKKALIANSPETFAAYTQVLISLLPANYRQVPVDVFLQYQWSISEGQTRTFLELPKNMKDGYWVVSSTPGAEWKEIKNEKGLSYESTKGVHKISKSASFLEGNKANQQTKESAPANSNVAGTSSSQGGKSAW